MQPSKTYIIQHKTTKELWKTDKGKASWSKPGFAKNSWAQSGNRYSRNGNVAHGRFDDQSEYEIVEVVPKSEVLLQEARWLLQEVLDSNREDIGLSTGLRIGLQDFMRNMDKEK